ncbi:DUF6722 family protein [Prevotella pallens]|jgi:hypothetical protein|uniref:DUF6722 family protein n=1 Tax=Prevotella pallens TaxID=60133 RepID=UPI0023F0FEE2|nr:DUF6722 family protein [Prevotella pallens]
MKKELGKWFMDIAKYMVTALLLSTAFGSMDRLWVLVCVVIGCSINLMLGALFNRKG